MTSEPAVWPAAERLHVMQQREGQRLATPATVMGFFSRDFVDVVVCPRKVSEVPGFGGTLRELTMIVHRDLWPAELLRVNADVWLLRDDAFEDYCDVCARDGDDPPDGYLQSHYGLHRAAMERLIRMPQRGGDATEASHGSRWWQVWPR